MSSDDPGAQAAYIAVPLGWVIMAGRLAEEFGVESWQALVNELQQDTDPRRIRALIANLQKRSPEDQKMFVCALALGANLILLLDTLLSRAEEEEERGSEPPS